MSTKLSQERSALHDRYAALRIKIIGHYRALALVGREPDAKAYKLPPKLGHWHEGHSERVRAACPELESVVRAIEALRAQRAPGAVLAKYGKPKVGGWRHRRSTTKVQTNPGEWPPKYK